MNQRNSVCLTLHDALRQACASAGIGPLPDLPTIGQVRCPGIGKPIGNRACWINIKNDVVHIYDHSSGFTTSVFKDQSITEEDRAEFRRKQRISSQNPERKTTDRHRERLPCVGPSWTLYSDELHGLKEN